MYLSLYRLKPIYSNIVLTLLICALLLSPFFGKGAAAVSNGPAPGFNADLGDAPDSTTQYGEKMTTYPSGEVANFPSAYASDLADPGPYHPDPRGFAWLGKWATLEADADLDPTLDEDGVTNIDPKANSADQDGADDGIHLPLQMPDIPSDICGYTTLKYDVGTINPTSDLLFNLWFDFNRDGDWEDTLDCQDAQGNAISVPEWAVQDENVTVLTPDITTLTTVPFAVKDPPTPDNPMWMRATLTTEKAPPSPISGVPAGGGPTWGYKYGETEDYYLDKSIPLGQPDLMIQKSATPDVFRVGEYADYTLTVTNNGNGPALAPITVVDTLPSGLTLVNYIALPWNCQFNAPTLQCTHPGSINPGDSTTIVIKVVVAPTAVPTVLNCATVQTDNDSDPNNDKGCVQNKVEPAAITPDTGDAPDSTNQIGRQMNAYPGVVAKFPTVYGNPIASVPGPMHRYPKQDAWLGRDVSGEKDADQLPDSDFVNGLPVTNLAPAANAADQDGADDGVDVKKLVLQECQMTKFDYKVTVFGAKKARYINVWVDLNRDGDWEDTVPCTLKGKRYNVPEWAVQDQNRKLQQDSNTVSTEFRYTNPGTVNKPMWMRITLSESKAVLKPNSKVADGRGPVNGYQYGETEDYSVPAVKANLAVTSAEVTADAAVDEPVEEVMVDEALDQPAEAVVTYEAFDEPAEGVVIDDADIVQIDDPATDATETDAHVYKTFLPFVEP